MVPSLFSADGSFGFLIRGHAVRSTHYASFAEPYELLLAIQVLSVSAVLAFASNYHVAGGANTEPLVVEILPEGCARIAYEETRQRYGGGELMPESGALHFLGR